MRLEALDLGRCPLQLLIGVRQLAGIRSVGGLQVRRCRLGLLERLLVSRVALLERLIAGLELNVGLLQTVAVGIQLSIRLQGGLLVLLGLRLGGAGVFDGRGVGCACRAGDEQSYRRGTDGGDESRHQSAEPGPLAVLPHASERRALWPRDRADKSELAAR